MRVITRMGLGTVELNSFLREPYVSVALDTPFAGDDTIRLGREEVFGLTDWATVKVLNVSGEGWFSNLRFHESWSEAVEELKRPAPPDETTFCLDLRDGKFHCNRRLGILVEEALLLRPWVDRWARERSHPFSEAEEALTFFRNEKVEMAGASGIQATILLDTRDTQAILGFYLLTEGVSGPVLQKEFPIPVLKERRQ